MTPPVVPLAPEAVSCCRLDAVPPLLTTARVSRIELHMTASSVSIFLAVMVLHPASGSPDANTRPELRSEGEYQAGRNRWTRNAPMRGSARAAMAAGRPRSG
jgi:hypothetical protein